MNMFERSVANTFAISIYSLIITLEGVKGKLSSSEIAVVKITLSINATLSKSQFSRRSESFFLVGFPVIQRISKKFACESFVFFIFNHFN